MTKTQKIESLYEKYVMHTYKRVPLCLDKARGAIAWDIDGNKYLDFFPGWAVSGIGHCHPIVARNIAAQRRRLFNWRTVGYSAGAHGLLLLETVVVLKMLGCGPWGTDFLIAAEAYAFMVFLPFFIANIGLREYSFGMMFGNLSPAFAAGPAPASVALGVSTLVLIMNVVLPAMAGLCVMAVDKKHSRTL